MSTILDWIDVIWNTIQAYRNKKLVEDIIEGEDVKKEVEKDLEEI